MFNPPPSHSRELRAVLRASLASMSSAARERVKEYMLNETNIEQGVFFDRAGKPDLYYTMFGLACADALELRLPWRNYQQNLLRYSLESLDVIHLCCWVKCALTTLAHRPVSCLSVKLILRLYYIRKFLKRSDFSSNDALLKDPYMLFLALNIHQDLRLDSPQRGTYLKALEACRTTDGRSYGKLESESSEGVVSITVAAILAKRQLGAGVDTEALCWLGEQQDSCGGFAASKTSPLPDTLSTAVALFTLRICGWKEGAAHKAAAAYLRDHWLDEGGFASVINDEQSDSEYTFYGLLAMGALAS